VANTNTPWGLKPWRGGGAYQWSEQGTVYCIPSTDNNAYYPYDAVKAAASSDANGVPNVTKITNGTDAIRGSIVGIYSVFPVPSLVATPLSLEYPYIPATKTQAYYVLVVDDPSTVFTMQDDGITTGNLVAASANLNSSFTVTAGASPQSLSGSVLLSSSFAATAQLNLKLEGLTQIPGNVYGAYAKWNVRINVSEFLMGPTGGTGV
jgi:hypothetical protein